MLGQSGPRGNDDVTIQMQLSVIPKTLFFFFFFFFFFYHGKFKPSDWLDYYDMIQEIILLNPSVCVHRNHNFSGVIAIKF